MQCLENWVLHLTQVVPTPEFLVEFCKFRIQDIVEYTGLYTQSNGGYFSRVDLIYCWITLVRLQLRGACILFDPVFCSEYGSIGRDIST